MLLLARRQLESLQSQPAMMMKGQVATLERVQGLASVSPNVRAGSVRLHSVVVQTRRYIAIGYSLIQFVSATFALHNICLFPSHPSHLPH
jgi:hypothetical protein